MHGLISLVTAVITAGAVVAATGGSTGTGTGALYGGDRPLQTISVGSCNSHSDESQQIFESAVNLKSDLWIWLGDAVYLDSMRFVRANLPIHNARTSRRLVLL